MSRNAPDPDLELRRLQTRALLDLARIRHASERFVELALEAAGLSGITPAQANALMVLFQARRPMNARQLASALSLSEVTVGRFVRALEGQGWVERERDPSDSRAYLLRPTATARRCLPRFIDVSNSLLDEAFATFDREDVERMAWYTAAVRRNLDPTD